MKDIDFLTEEYRIARRERQATVWRMIMLGVVCVVLGTATMGQYHVRRQLLSSLAVADAERDGASTRSSNLKLLEAELEKLNQRAEMLTYLRHPWPRTQLIAAVVAPLPKTIQLQRVAVVREASQATNTTTPDAPPQPEPAPTTEPASKAVADLEQLRSENKKLAVVVLVTGTASDFSDLHVYLSRVAASEMLGEPQLEAVHTLQEGDTTNHKFSARFIATETVDVLKTVQPPAAGVAAAQTGAHNIALHEDVR